MFKRTIATTLAASLLFATVGCSALNAPVQPVPVVVDQNIETTFTALQAGMLALMFVPGLPPVVVTEAKATLAALQTAYNTYKAAAANGDASLTQYQAAVQAAIQAAQTLLASQNMAVKTAAVKLAH